MTAMLLSNSGNTPLISVLVTLVVHISIHMLLYPLHKDNWGTMAKRLLAHS